MMLSKQDASLNRSQETLELLQPVLEQVVHHLAKADAERHKHVIDEAVHDQSSSLVASQSLSAETLSRVLPKTLEIPAEGIGRDGILETVSNILSYSVNTSAPGFLDKLYGSSLPPGIAADLVLSVLNTNSHVYQVSPVLTLVEKQVTKAIARLFGLTGPRAGGINVQGGSASNLTSIVLARNTLFPETKSYGNAAANNGKLSLFTSAHGHYSIEKAAQALGFGSQSVISVPVDKQGRMNASELDILIQKSRAEGNVPFYINATAGSTVLGSFDPFDEIAVVAARHQCWLHIDGAWGGGFIFANRTDMRQRLKGAEKADSIAVNPHKMLGVPLTCSFLLTRDVRLLEAAMTLRAGYLFHDNPEDDLEFDDAVEHTKPLAGIVYAGPADLSLGQSRATDAQQDIDTWSEPNDLADLTLQCGRRGDSLKFFLSWQYYGSLGYQQMVEKAYELAVEVSQLVDRSLDFRLVLEKGSLPQCLQVCYYFTPGGKFAFGTADEPGTFIMPRKKRSNNDQKSNNETSQREAIGKYNSIVTSRMTRALVPRGFMIDFAPALEGREDRGSFFRVVINISTVRETMQRLLEQMLEVGHKVIQELGQKCRTREEDPRG